MESSTEYWNFGLRILTDSIGSEEWGKKGQIQFFWIFLDKIELRKTFIFRDIKLFVTLVTVVTLVTLEVGRAN